MKRKFRKLQRKINQRIKRYYLSKVTVSNEIKILMKFKSEISFLFNYETFSKNFNKEEVNNFLDDIKDADEIVKHNFSFLGIDKKSIGAVIDWHKDYKSNFIWDKKYFADFKIIDLDNNADVKIPWEMSRFQHFFILGKAYFITGKDIYVNEFKDQFIRWIQENPVEMSINWACTMDVAIRVVNLIYAYNFFKNSIKLDKEFWYIFNNSIYSHGKFIFHNLENLGINKGNHYLSNIVGLLYCGIYFRDCKSFNIKRKSEKWINFALRELEKEILVQVNLDGTNYESSTAYHRLVTELFLYPYIIGLSNKIKFSKEYEGRLKKMLNFIVDLTKPNMLSPIIGDADDGRLLIVSNYSNWNRRDFTHILNIGGVLFNNPEYCYYGRNYNDAFWILGKQSKNIENKKYKCISKEFRDSGYYILKNTNFYCFIRCGELAFHSKGGGHSHNDQMSFELNIKGEDFIIDPGVYVYTSNYKMRNLFRSTEVHNTLFIKGLEQNNIKERDLFFLADETKSKLIEFNKDTFEGIHFGYLNKIGIEHKRKIEIIEERMIIRDFLNKKCKDAYINFTLDKDVIVTKENYGYLLEKKLIKIKLMTNLSGEIKTGFISYRYGKSLETRRLVFKVEDQSAQIIIEFK